MNRKYNESYMLTHSIDWFFQIRGRMCMVRSNGGYVPDFIKVRQNRKVQDIIYAILLENNAIARILNAKEIIQSNYYSDVKFHSNPNIPELSNNRLLAYYGEMAKLGMNCYHCYAPEDGVSWNYILIAERPDPEGNGTNSILDAEILQLISELPDVEIDYLQDPLYYFVEANNQVD